MNIKKLIIYIFMYIYIYGFVYTMKIIIRSFNLNILQDGLGHVFVEMLPSSLRIPLTHRIGRNCRTTQGSGFTSQVSSESMFARLLHAVLIIPMQKKQQHDVPTIT